MYSHPTTKFIYPPNIPVINRRFDRFELNIDLQSNMREAEIATFYHDGFNSEE